MPFTFLFFSLCKTNFVYILKSKSQLITLSMKTKLLLAIFWLLCASALHAQWRQKTNPGDVYDIASIGSDLYLSTSTGLYLSTDNGETSSKKDDIVSSSLAVLNGDLYANDIIGGSTHIFSTSTGVHTSFGGGEYGEWRVGENILAAIGSDVYSGADMMGNSSAARMSADRTSWTPLYDCWDVRFFAEVGINIYGVNRFQGQVRVSTDNGNTWALLNPGVPWDEEKGDTDFTSLVAVGSDLFAGTNSGGIFRMAENGTSWTSVSTGLPDLDATGIYYVFSAGNILYTYRWKPGAPYRVFRSGNLGESWSELTGDFPSDIGIRSLKVVGSELFAGTGAGLWSLPVDAIETPIKTHQTINFVDIPAKTFGDVPFALTAAASSGLPVAFTSNNTDVATVSDNIVTIVGAGTIVITASQAGDANFNAAPSVVQTLTVNKVNQTITFAALAAKRCGDAPFTLTAAASSGLPISYTSSNRTVATISGNTITIVGIGSTTITASQPGNTNFNAAANVGRTLTVNKGNQTIAFAALAAKRIGDAPFTLTGTTSSGLPVSYASSNTTVATISGNTVTIVGSGTTTITASQAGNTNFNAAASVVRTLTVNKANQTITFAALAAARVGDARFALTGTASSGLSITYASSNTTVATIGAEIIGGIFVYTIWVVGPGTTAITASQAGNTNFNAAASVVRTLTVNKANQTITFASPATARVGDAPFALTGAASSRLQVFYASSNTTVARVWGNTVYVVGAGTTTITASQPGNTNFNAAANVGRTLTVNKGNQIITFDAIPEKTLGDDSFRLTGTASSNLPISYASSNATVATISGNTVTVLGLGTTTITASQAGNANFNASVNVQQTLTIKNVQTITFPAIPEKNLTDAPFTLSASASSGLPVSFTSSNTGVATISGNTVTIVRDGVTYITASQAGNGSYGQASARETLYVRKVPQTISFAALTEYRRVGDVFELTATASSGLPVSFTSSNTGVATISGNTVATVGVGVTYITASQAGNDFYAKAEAKRFFYGNKTPQTITFDALTENRRVGDAPFTLTATASSGLPVRFTSGNTSAATISGNTVTIVGAGFVLINAVQDGDSFYQAANIVQRWFTVNPSSTSAAKVNSVSSTDQTSIITGDIESVEPEIFISPNPVEGLLELHGIVGEIQANQLFDMTGRAGSPLAFEKNNNRYSASVEHLSQGVYLLRLLQENKVVQIKFIKK
jgi:hypothetical protein